MEKMDPSGLANPIGNMLSGKAELRMKAAGIRTRKIASVLCRNATKECPEPQRQPFSAKVTETRIQSTE